MEILRMLHTLATVIWVGGMFFAHQCLRPVALAQLEPPQRLKLWNAVFARFFPWVWSAVILLITTGLALVMRMGGMAEIPVHLHIMAGIGYLMAGIFATLYFRPYAQLRKAVAAENWPVAGNALNRIRLMVAVNLSLGLANIILVFALPLLD
jgi:uncharacterized membrane protein